MATNFHYKCNSWWFNYITGERIMACPFTIKEKKLCCHLYHWHINSQFSWRKWIFMLISKFAVNNWKLIYESVKHQLSLVSYGPEIFISWFVNENFIVTDIVFLGRNLQEITTISHFHSSLFNFQGCPHSNFT
jgi:hypothetical protein